MDQQRRLQLHEILCDILGSRNVYFQPPATIILKYPCIIYSRNDRSEIFSDGILYSKKWQYDVVAIDTNPDSEVPSKIGDLIYASYDRHYIQDNLNHDVFRLYY